MNSKPIYKLSSNTPSPKSSTTESSTTQCSTTDCLTTECSTTESSTTHPTSPISKDMSSILDTLPIISNNLENYIQINNLNDIQYIENKYLIISKKNCIF